METEISRINLSIEDKSDKFSGSIGTYKTIKYFKEIAKND